MYQSFITLATKPGDIIDIVENVQEIIIASGLKNGMCNIFSQHSTCAVFVNENETMLLEDLKKALAELVPDNKLYHHPTNAQSHIRAMLLGGSISIPIRDSRLQLGQWQSVLVAELDAQPRKREIVVSIYSG